MSQDMGLELGRRCLGLKFVLLTTAKKLHPPPCTDSLLHPSCKNREVSLQSWRSFAHPCFHSPSQHWLLVLLFSLAKTIQEWGCLGKHHRNEESWHLESL